MSALAKKFLIKPGQRWLFLHAPENYLATLEPLPAGVETVFEAEGLFDGAQLFVKNSAELTEELKIVVPVLKPDAVFWICYPKKASGIPTDLEMTHSWDEPAKYGLHTVTAASVNEHWTSLRLRTKALSKISDTCNTELPKNDAYSAFVDLEKRTVTLPPDLKEAMEQEPATLASFEKLSFSNKKEYVLWVLSAKQEKTRTERVTKTVEKLLTGKKNPSEK